MTAIKQMLHRAFPAIIFMFVLVVPLGLTGATQSAAPKKKPSATTAKPGPKVPLTASKDLFVDVASAAGIDFHLTCGGKEKLYILETQCGGAAAFDYDNDGWMDILLVDGSTIEDYRAGKCHLPRLYRNQHDGTFADVSAKSGLNFCGWGYGVALGVLDYVGWEDVDFPAFPRSTLLYPHNQRK